MEERLKFLAAVSESGESFAQVCRRFGVSRKTGYKWFERWNKKGPAGIEERPPIAKTCPHQTPKETVEALVSLRREHPTWGPKKLRAWLEARGGVGSLPAHSTIAHILSEHGLIRPRRPRLRTPPGVQRLVPGLEPNELWCVDFKGNFVLGDKTRCYPLTITDHASRYLLRCTAMTITKEPLVRLQFESVFREFGIPDRIRSDNGPPFASVGVGGLSALSIWWIKLGILPERIEPGHPEQNGRHERMHRTMESDAVRPPAQTIPEQQTRFDRFRHVYNDERPHEALDMRVPRSRYGSARRVLPERVQSPEYAEGMTVRTIGENGALKHRGTRLLVSRLLAGEPVGLQQNADDSWFLFYGPVLLGELHWDSKKLRLEPVAYVYQPDSHG